MRRQPQQRIREPCDVAVRDHPPRSLVLGSPAKVKRELTHDELAYLDRSWRNYVELKKSYLAADERG